jgi:4-amino-4-deoxy-L-arabinose transferase-like glycosyltransferase
MKTGRSTAQLAIQRAMATLRQQVGQSFPASDRSTWVRWAVPVLFVVFAAASVSRDLSWTMPAAEAWIGHADQANVADIARNLAEGRGPVVNNHWLLTDGGLDDTSLPHGEPYWSIYVAYVIALVMVVLGPNLGAVLVAASLIKVAIAAVCARMAWKVAGPAASTAVSVVLLYDRSMVERVDGLSDIYWALTATLTFVALWWILRRPDASPPWLLAGFATGVGFGFRLPSVLFVGPIVGVGAWLLWRQRGRPVRGVVLAGGAAALGALPYVAYNLATGGTVWPPGLQLVRRASAIRSMTGNNNLAFYGFEDVGVEAVGLVPPLTTAYEGVGRFLKGMGSGDVVSGWLLVATVVAIVGAAAWTLLRRERLGANLAIVWSLGLAWLGIGFLVAAVTHYESRYWTFLVPVVVLVAAVSLARIHRHAPAVLILVAVAAIAGQRNAAFPIRPVPQAYSEVAEALPPGAVVLSSDPWEFAFHTRLGAVAVPYTDDPEVVEAVARKYRATHLAVVEDDVRHPGLAAALETVPPAGWEVLDEGARWVVYVLPDAVEP